MSNRRVWGLIFIVVCVLYPITIPLTTFGDHYWIMFRGSFVVPYIEKIICSIGFGIGLWLSGACVRPIESNRVKGLLTLGWVIIASGVVLTTATNCLSFYLFYKGDYTTAISNVHALIKNWISPHEWMVCGMTILTCNCKSTTIDKERYIRSYQANKSDVICTLIGFALTHILKAKLQSYNLLFVWLLNFLDYAEKGWFWVVNGHQFIDAFIAFVCCLIYSEWIRGRERTQAYTLGGSSALYLLVMIALNIINIANNADYSLMIQQDIGNILYCVAHFTCYLIIVYRMLSNNRVQSKYGEYQIKENS